MTLAAPARRCRVTRPRPAARTPRDDTSPRRRAATPRHDAAPRRLAATPRHDAAPRRLAAAPRRDGLIVFVFSRRACAWAGVSIGVSRATRLRRAIGRSGGGLVSRSFGRCVGTAPRDVNLACVACASRLRMRHIVGHRFRLLAARVRVGRGLDRRIARVCGARSDDRGAVWSRDRLVGASAPCLVTSLERASRARRVFVCVTSLVIVFVFSQRARASSALQ